MCTGSTLVQNTAWSSWANGVLQTLFFGIRERNWSPHTCFYKGKASENSSHPIPYRADAKNNKCKGWYWEVWRMKRAPSIRGYFICCQLQLIKTCTSVAEWWQEEHTLASSWWWWRNLERKEAGGLVWFLTVAAFLSRRVKSIPFPHANSDMSLYSAASDCCLSTVLGS